jgi:cytoskeletal protein CcmA (bactofilin family)
MVGPADWPARRFNMDRNDDAKRPSLLCPGLEIKGDVISDHELVILGHVTGRRVQAPVITIGPAAIVRADIRTGSIRIEGAVVGDIHAQLSVIVQATATIRGSIHSPAVTIRDGACVNGGANVKLARDAGADRTSRTISRPAARRAG